MTIWKFPLAVADRQLILMPEGSVILSVATQFGVPVLWAMVDPEKPMRGREISTVGTGHDLPIGQCGEFVGSYQMHRGHLVFHVFAESAS